MHLHECTYAMVFLINPRPAAYVVSLPVVIKTLIAPVI